MIYRLRVILDNDTNEDILRDVEIDKNSNLTDLHELILLSFNFSADQMASFYTVDEEWNQINEISLMNFDESTDSMDSILIANILNNQNTKLLYIYDFMNMWTFYVELIEEAQEINNILYPRIIFSVGNVPEKAPDKKFINEVAELIKSLMNFCSYEIKVFKDEISIFCKNNDLKKVIMFLKDNPSLTCRLPGLNKFSPSRLVMDTNLRFPINCNLAKTAKNIETIIFTSKNSSARKINLLKNKGIEIIKIPTTKSGLSLISALKFLGKKEFNSILIEGGNKLIASAINSPQLNKIYWFSSEKIIGEEGKPSIGKLNITNLESSPNLFLHNMINLDNNYLKIYKAKN